MIEDCKVSVLLNGNRTSLLHTMYECKHKPGDHLGLNRAWNIQPQGIKHFRLDRTVDFSVESDVSQHRSGYASLGTCGHLGETM